MIAYVQDVGVLARKDLMLELRSRDTVPAMLLFVVSALVVFHFALPESAGDDAARGLLWIAILFTALLGLGRVYAAEREQGGLDGLLLAPSDRSVIWLAKTSSVVVFLLVMEVIAVPAFALFYAPVSAAMIGSILLANVGIAAVGTLLSAIALASRARDLLLPLLFLPLAIPVIIGGVGASVADDPGRFLWFLGLYDVIFAIISWASFEYVVTE